VVLWVYEVGTYMIKEITEEKLMDIHDESVQSDLRCCTTVCPVVIVSSFGIGGVFIYSNSPKVEASICKMNFVLYW